MKNTPGGLPWRIILCSELVGSGTDKFNAHLVHLGLECIRELAVRYNRCGARWNIQRRERVFTEL